MNPIGEAQFCIKPDYVANTARLTFDPQGDHVFWTAARIAGATRFQRAVYERAARLVRERGLRSALDIGCGPPFKQRALLAAGLVEVVLVDQPAVASLAADILPGARFVAADLESIELDLGRRFDLVICADVLEHLVDPDVCLRFALRHCDRHSLLLVSTPERDRLRGRACACSPQPEHVREWNQDELARYLRGRGLTIIEHEVLPQTPIGPVRRAWERARHALGLVTPHLCCQLAVCRLAGEGG